jgi:hypothetical protein
MLLTSNKPKVPIDERQVTKVRYKSKTLDIGRDVHKKIPGTGKTQSLQRPRTESASLDRQCIHPPSVFILKQTSEVDNVTERSGNEKRNVINRQLSCHER